MLPLPCFRSVYQAIGDQLADLQDALGFPYRTRFAALSATGSFRLFAVSSGLLRVSHANMRERQNRQKGIVLFTYLFEQFVRVSCEY